MDDYNKQMASQKLGILMHDCERLCEISQALKAIIVHETNGGRRQRKRETELIAEGNDIASKYDIAFFYQTDPRIPQIWLIENLNRKYAFWRAFRGNITPSLSNYFRCRYAIDGIAFY